jgi:hypothetical protein
MTSCSTKAECKRSSKNEPRPETSCARICSPSLQLYSFFWEVAVPLRLLWQRAMVGNVTALPELHNLSLSLLFLDHSKGRVGEVQILFGVFLVTTRPANHIHEATLVAITVRNAECIYKSVIEWRKCFLQAGIEGLVQSK